MRDFADDLPTNREMQSRKGLMLIRLLTICQILESARRPKTLNELHSEVNQRMLWEWSERTLQRDMEVLERMQVVCETRRAGEFAFTWIGLHNFDPKKT